MGHEDAHGRHRRSKKEYPRRRLRGAWDTPTPVLAARGTDGAWGVGFGVWGLGFGVWGLGFRV